MIPRISVIIPAYNRFLDLTLSVQSVLAQTVPVTEVIVVDDGSTDETPELFPRCISGNPLWRKRVQYFRQENQGQSVALDNGIARAKGEWLGFNAHDDLWLPRKLEWQFLALGAGNADCGLCFTDAWFTNNPRMRMTLFEFGGARYDKLVGVVKDPADLVQHLYQAWVQTVIVRADVVRRVGGFDPLLRYGEDYDFMFRMALATKCCYVNLPMVLIDRSPADRRHGGASLEWHKEEFRLRNMQYLCEKNLSREGGLQPAMRKVLCEQLRGIHSAWASRYLENGDYEKAQEAIYKAFKYHFTPKSAFKWALAKLAPGLTRNVVLMGRRLRERRMPPDPMAVLSETGGQSPGSRQSL